MCRLVSAVSQDHHYHHHHRRRNNNNTSPTSREYITYILDSSPSRSCSRGRGVALVEVTSLIETTDDAPQEYARLRQASDEFPMGIIICTSQNPSHRIFTCLSLQIPVAAYLGVVLLMAPPYPSRILPSKRLDRNLLSQDSYNPTLRSLSPTWCSQDTSSVRACWATCLQKIANIAATLRQENTA